MVFAAHEHAYEELREIVINLLLDSPDNGAGKFETLLDKVARELLHDEALDVAPVLATANIKAVLHPNDAELVLEIVWDLFRQGIVTFRVNAAKPGWPWIRLSRFGECALQHGTYRLHNKAAFLKALERIDLTSEAILYLKEAVAAFYAGRLLSSAVMLGLAAEREFLRLLDIARTSRTYGRHFARIGDASNIRAKVAGFRQAVRPLLVHFADTTAEEVEVALNTISSIVRPVRGEVGEPSAAVSPSRDEVYVHLQLFVALAETLAGLNQGFADADHPCLAPAQ